MSSEVVTASHSCLSSLRSVSLARSLLSTMSSLTNAFVTLLSVVLLLLDICNAQTILTTIYTPSAGPASEHICAWRCYSTSVIGSDQTLCPKTGAAATRTPVVAKRAFRRLEGREIVNNSTLTTVSFLPPDGFSVRL